MMEVPFIGHIATDKGLRGDPGNQRNASSNRQSLSPKTLGSRVVSQQVPPSTVRYYKTYERADAE